MKRASLVLALVLGCGSVTPTGPVAPPKQEGTSASPRLDGIYMSLPTSQTGGTDLLRFVDSEYVVSVSTTSRDVERAVSMLHQATPRCARGKYSITDGVLRFTMKSDVGNVEYAAKIVGDKLSTRWRSEINDTTREEDFTFHTTSFLRIVAKTDPPAEPSEPAPDAVAEAPTNPESSLIPEGAAWYCFRAGGSASRCERKLAVCESSRKTAATVRRDAKIGKCTKAANAYCFTVRRGENRGAASCSAAQADCDVERATVAAESASAEVNVSACSRE